MIQEALSNNDANISVVNMASQTVGGQSVWMDCFFLVCDTVLLCDLGLAKNYVFG